jgi:O-antigen/teichoic acid export membrane protein
VTRGEDARAVARTVGRLTAVALAAVTLVVAAAWGPITDRLFSGHGYLTACLLAGIAGYAVSYYVRGIASGLQWLGGYGVLLLVDGAARVALVAPLLVVASAPVAAVAIVAAAVLGPLALLLARGNSPRRLLARLDGAPAPRLGLASAARFAVPVGIVAGAEQTLVSGGALLAAVTSSGDAAAAAGTVFAATMLVRAPVFLFQGVAAALLPRFTELHTRGDQAQIRRALGLAGAGTLGLSAVLAAGALVCGPELMRLLFGPGFDVARGDLAVLCAGVGCYLAAATLSQAALARALAARTALAWLAAALAFVALELSLGGSPMHKVAVAFTVATGLNAALLALALRRTGT